MLIYLHLNIETGSMEASIVLRIWNDRFNIWFDTGNRTLLWLSGFFLCTGLEILFLMQIISSSCPFYFHRELFPSLKTSLSFALLNINISISWMNKWKVMCEAEFIYISWHHLSQEHATFFFHIIGCHLKYTDLCKHLGQQSSIYVFE